VISSRTLVNGDIYTIEIENTEGRRDYVTGKENSKLLM
jgi:hypothetical protein